MTKTHVIASTAAGALAVFLFSLFPITDFDIWFHLAEGKLMIQNWYFPYTDVFSYTAQGAPNYPNSWGFTAFSYAAFKLLGLDGLNIIKAAFPALIFCLIAFFLYRQKLLSWFGLIFPVAALFSMRESLSLRPHTFTYLPFAGFLLALSWYRDSRSTKAICFLAGIQFFWVNIHASSVWGPALAILFLGAEYLKTHTFHKKDVLLVLAVFSAASLHVFYGPSYLFRIVTEFFTPSAQAPIREALPLTIETFFSFQGIILLFVPLLLFLAYKKRHYEFIVFPIALLAVSFFNGRFLRDLTIFLAVAVPLYIPMCETWFHTTLLRGAKIPSWIGPFALGILLFVLFLLAKNSPLGIGLGLEKFAYPVKAVQFLQENRILELSKSNLYHTYNFGGYLMWTNQPYGVYIDGRVRPYHGEVFNRYWDNFEGGRTWMDTVQRYHIGAALMTLAHTDGTTIYNDSSRMFPKEEWALVYYDDIAALYVRRMDELQQFIQQNEYTILKPQALDLSYLQEYAKSEKSFQEARGEVQRGLSTNPDSYRLHFTAAYLYSLAGLNNQMREELEKTLKINPYFQPAKNVLELSV